MHMGKPRQGGHLKNSNTEVISLKNMKSSGMGTKQRVVRGVPNEIFCNVQLIAALPEIVGTYGVVHSILFQSSPHRHNNRGSSNSNSNDSSNDSS